MIRILVASFPLVEPICMEPLTSTPSAELVGIIMYHLLCLCEMINLSRLNYKAWGHEVMGTFFQASAFTLSLIHI